MPRENPRPPIDAAVGRAASIATSTSPPATWRAIEAYAARADAAVQTWVAAGASWDLAYSGPASLADHVVLGLMRARGAVPSWTAHFAALPTHSPGGQALTDEATDGALRDACVRGLIDGSASPRDAVGMVLALVASQADQVVVATEELGRLLLELPALAPARARLAERMTLWTRPAVIEPTGAAGRISPDGRPGAIGAGERPGVIADEPPGTIDADDRPDRVDPAAGASGLGSGPLVVTARVDETTLMQLRPVLVAYRDLGAGVHRRVRLRLLTNAAKAVAPELRRHHLEPLVAVAADPGPGVSARHAAEGAFALVLDAPAPAGRSWSPADLPELADHAALDTPVILVAPQDSPLTSAPVAHHLPAGHVSAAMALLDSLASARGS